MASATDSPFAPGTLLPAASLLSVPDGEPVALRGGRGPRVLVIAHPEDCTGCREYIEELAASTDELGKWGGRVLVVVPGSLDRAVATSASASAPFPVLADSDATFAVVGSAVVIADEWGEIYFSIDADAEHGLPTPEEIVDWVRFISIQCPECEQPEGEWRTI